eukprot:scaffold1757_cov266-Pinguiococcus_pyrenoidosus.AAC.7
MSSLIFRPSPAQRVNSQGAALQNLQMKWYLKEDALPHLHPPALDKKEDSLTPASRHPDAMRDVTAQRMVAH